MGKKHRQGESGSGGEGESRPPIISRRGWKIIAAGCGLAAVGYVVLSFTDPRGQNWASKTSPFLILGGYAGVGWGILARDRI